MLACPAWPSVLYKHFTARVRCQIRLGGCIRNEKHNKKKAQFHPNLRDTRVEINQGKTSVSSMWHAFVFLGCSYVFRNKSGHCCKGQTSMKYLFYQCRRRHKAKEWMFYEIQNDSLSANLVKGCRGVDFISGTELSYYIFCNNPSPHSSV